MTTICLPPLPAQAMDVTDVEARALQARDDVALARTRLGPTAPPVVKAK